jgi:hypothetical protein
VLLKQRRRAAQQRERGAIDAQRCEGMPISAFEDDDVHGRILPKAKLALLDMRHKIARKNISANAMDLNQAIACKRRVERCLGM